MTIAAEVVVEEDMVVAIKLFLSYLATVWIVEKLSQKPLEVLGQTAGERISGSSVWVPGVVRSFTFGLLGSFFD